MFFFCDSYQSKLCKYLFAQSNLQICLISLWFGISCSVGNFFSKMTQFSLDAKVPNIRTDLLQDPVQIPKAKKINWNPHDPKTGLSQPPADIACQGWNLKQKLVTCFFRLGFPELMSAVGVLNILYSPLLLLLAKVSKPDPEINVSRERIYISSLASNPWPSAQVVGRETQLDGGFEVQPAWRQTWDLFKQTQKHLR